jgi:protein SCO1/2
MSVRARRERVALLALGCLALITAGWWALALWPAGDTPPAWLERARGGCFNAGGDGLPDASGWLLLVGQPLGMLAVLMAVWGDQVRGGLRSALRSASGRVAVGSLAALLAAGLVASAARVLDAKLAGEDALAREVVPPTYPRLDRPAPALALVDQQGESFGLDALRGRPALVTFAFGNCETVCPAVVKQVVAAQQQMRDRASRGEISSGAVPRLVIVSLDPWRDTPGRLGHLVSHWGLGDDAHVLTGTVDEVESVLDAWNVARRRDPDTGDVTHPSLVYVLDAQARLVYATRGETEAVVELLGRVDAGSGGERTSQAPPPDSTGSASPLGRRGG